MTLAPVPSPETQRQPRQRFVSQFLTSTASAAWTDKSPPPYRWMVHEIFAAGTVVMLSGDGGAGKSLLAQQLCTAAAIGAEWLGKATRRCKSFYFACEDDDAELHRRQERINRHYGCEMPDLDDFMFTARAGAENVLMTFHKNDDRGTRTPLFEQLCNAVRDHGAQIVILDTLSDVFSGNEIIRTQARRFISALRQLAMEQDGIVILTSHPSLTGINTGSGISGSTAWRNSVRSQVYLTKPKQEDDDREDVTERVLRVMKNNAAAAGGKISLEWRDGVFVRTDQAGSSPIGFVASLDMQRHILDTARALIANGVMLAADPAAPNSLANRTRKEPACKGYRYSAVCSAQDKMLAEGKLVRVTIGPPSKARVYLRPSDSRYPSEIE